MRRPFLAVSFSTLLFAPTDRGNTSNTWHALGLCSQVQDVLSCLLSGECADERLWGVSVYSVEPLAGANRLLIRVGPTHDEASLDVWQTLETLNAARSYFRREIAREIHRKRVPDLEFAWVLPGEVVVNE